MKYFLSLRLFLLLFCLLYAVPAAAVPFAVPADASGADAQSGQLRLLLEDLAGQRGAVINMQRELVSRPALNPESGGEGEENKARWVESWLRQQGIDGVERLDAPDPRVPSGVRPNLIIRRPGLSERTLWIFCHMDTAAPGSLDLWTSSPFALRVDGDTIYGRGVEDNNQGMATALLLLDSLNRNRVTAPLSLGIILSSAEKSLFLGLRHILKERPGLLRPDDFFLVPDYGVPDGSLIEVAEKGSLWLRFSVRGKQAHSGLPHTGVNALTAGARLIVDLAALETEFPARNELFSPPVSTFTPTKVEASSGGINVLPGEFVFSMDCRLIAGTIAEGGNEAEALEKAVKKITAATAEKTGTSIAVERLQAVTPAPQTPPDAPLVLALQRAVGAQWHGQALPKGIGGVTIASLLRAGGLEAVVWEKAAANGHEVDEKASVRNHLDQMRVFARLLFDEELGQAAKKVQP